MALDLRVFATQLSELLRVGAGGTTETASPEQIADPLTGVPSSTGIADIPSAPAASAGGQTEEPVALPSSPSPEPAAPTPAEPPSPAAAPQPIPVYRPAVAGAAPALTLDVVRTMTPQEINGRWDEVSALLRREGGR